MTIDSSARRVGSGGAAPSNGQWQTLGVGAVLTVVAALLIWFYTMAVSERSFEALRQRGISLARLMAQVSEGPLAAAGRSDPQTTLDRLSGQEDLVYAAVVDGAGTVIGESGPGARAAGALLIGRPQGAARLPATRSDCLVDPYGERLYVFSVPVTRRGDGRAPSVEEPPIADGGLGPRSASAAPRIRPSAGPLLGEVRVVLSATRMDQADGALLLRGLGFGALLVLGGVLASGTISRRLLARPAAGLLEVTGQLDEAVEEIRETADLLVEGTLRQQESLQKIAASAEAVSRSLREVASGAGGLSTSSEETSSSILSMVASIEEVAGHADGLTMSVNDTSQTIEEMVASIKEIDRNVELLNRFVAETSGAMADMGRALQHVERNAAESKEISELVAQNADKGMRAVELTIEGMEAIRGSVADSGQAIASVGRRGQEIGLILSVIQEVTEQTNLLALNAAIIAAQAGEHGRGFAVVADEIRQLAERTATSAKEIGALIASFQADTTRAVALMQEGSRRVEAGRDRSQEAGRALKEILESARRSSAQVGEIASATREQAHGRRVISASVEKVSEMVGHIKQATAEQSLGSEQINSAVENMREMAGHVKRATVEQAKGSRTITEAIENVADRVGAIHKSATEQSATADHIIKTLSAFASVTSANLVAATRMQQANEALRSRARSLRGAVARLGGAGFGH